MATAPLQVKITGGNRLVIAKYHDGGILKFRDAPVIDNSNKNTSSGSPGDLTKEGGGLQLAIEIRVFANCSPRKDSLRYHVAGTLQETVLQTLGNAATKAAEARHTYAGPVHCGRIIHKWRNRNGWIRREREVPIPGR
jgi:hypothetical protein